MIPLSTVAPRVHADVVIHDERLMVNGIAYEKLSPSDTVIVDHGQVIINTHIAGRSSETQ